MRYRSQRAAVTRSVCLGLGEDRRKKQALEIETTFRVLKIKKLGAESSASAGLCYNEARAPSYAPAGLLWWLESRDAQRNWENYPLMA